MQQIRGKGDIVSKFRRTVSMEIEIKDSCALLVTGRQLSIDRCVPGSNKRSFFSTGRPVQGNSLQGYLVTYIVFAFLSLCVSERLKQQLCK